MNGHEYEIGLHKLELDTPALLVDVCAMENNLLKMSSFFDGKETKLRPHVKLHKATPILSHLQLAASNTVGLTCAKLSEAEVLAQSGIGGILIANQVVGKRKVNRLANLAAYSDVMVAVDSTENVQELSGAASDKGIQIGVLVEVNIGQNRCGVAPFKPALDLVERILESPHLKFKGIMGYDGHCTRIADLSEREALSKKANQLLADTHFFIEDKGIPVEIISGGGTYTYKYASSIKGVTEIQAGTYLLMDTAFYGAGITDFLPTLSILSTVTSRPTYPGAKHLAIIDVGSKAIAQRRGIPEIKSPDGASIINLSQEHGRVDLNAVGVNVRIGDKIEIWVHDANATINIYDKFYAIRDDIVEAVWDIPARGLAT